MEEYLFNPTKQKRMLKSSVWSRWLWRIGVGFLIGPPLLLLLLYLVTGVTITFASALFIVPVILASAGVILMISSFIISWKNLGNNNAEKNGEQDNSEQPILPVITNNNEHQNEYTHKITDCTNKYINNQKLNNFKSLEDHFKTYLPKCYVNNKDEFYALNDISEHTKNLTSNNIKIKTIDILSESAPEASFNATYFHLSCQSQENSPELIKLMLDFGANPTIKDDEGDTALHYAARNEGTFENTIDIIIFLLNSDEIKNYKEAWEGTRNDKNESPLDILNINPAFNNIRAKNQLNIALVKLDSQKNNQNKLSF